MTSPDQRHVKSFLPYRKIRKGKIVIFG